MRLFLQWATGTSYWQYACSFTCSQPGTEASRNGFRLFRCFGIFG